MMKRICPQLPRSWILIAACVLAIGIALNISALVVTLPGLDEAGYLGDGANLVERGVVPALGSGPLPAVVNGLIYLPFRGDHIRLGLVSTIRRFVTYVVVVGATWWAAYKLAGTLGGWVALVLASVGRPLAVVLDNSADALYTALSVLVFSILIALAVDWRSSPTPPPRWKRRALAAGLALGVSALARLDGLLLGVLLTLTVFAIALAGRRAPGPRPVSLVAAGAVGFAGFAIPVIAWVVFSGVARGDWNLQIRERSYLAFEQAHNFLYTDRYEVVPSPSAADLYRSAEQNHYSVLTAILHNPRAFLSRVPLVLGNIVRMYFNAYSIVGGVLFGILALAGVVFLFGTFPALGAFALVWGLPLLGYLLASYRPGFLGTVYPEGLVVLAAGAAPALGRLREWMAQVVLRPLLVVWGLVLLLVLGSNVQYGLQQAESWWKGDRGAAEVAWVRLLAQRIPRGECLISYSQAQAVYANLRPFGEWTLFSEVHTAPQLVDYIQQHDCRWVVVDDDMRKYAPGFALQVETTLAPQFSNPDGSRTAYWLPR